MSPSSTIPQFYFPKVHKRTDDTALLMEKVKSVFQQHECMTELEFESVTTLCSLPRFMSLALFRAIDMLNDQNDQVTFEQFERSWPILIQEHIKKSSIDDIHSLMYFILKKPELDCLTPDDFLPVLEDIVLNHPALQFLEDNITFQERYIETVICRLFYDANCISGRLTLESFKKSGIASILQSLTHSIDLYTANHDLTITETDLSNYNMGTLTRLAVERIIKVGHIAAFADTMVIAEDDTAATAPSTDPPVSLTYFDFIWFLLSENNVNINMLSIQYRFRCLDIDDDGVLSSYELAQFWQDQTIKQHFYGSTHTDDGIQFDDIMRQMNDLIQPQTPGQFTLKDLKKNGFLAERFFDTFINYDRFQVHESRQEGSIREQQAYQNKELLEMGVYGAQEPVILTDDLGFPILTTWNDFADIEYHRIILDENFASSYDDEDQEIEHKSVSEDEGLVFSRHTSCIAATSTNQDSKHTANKNDLIKEDQHDDNSSVSSATSFSSTVSEPEHSLFLSSMASIDISPEAETDSNDDEFEDDEFEEILNSSCIFTPRTLVEGDDGKLVPSTNDLNNATKSFFDLKTEHPHHQQHNVSFIH
ncbi:hypothetical protein BD408DRAFT_445275 [Parasitella parasitica]|nr:hypothetical protein BD408DRAFT_445275 [Parasitella parasitica]